MAVNTTKKRSFERRMSKKVAELTQVVHMLFMKHHEKELELEALKDAYEHEIDLVITDARGQLDELTRELLQVRELSLREKKPEEEEKVDEESQMKIRALDSRLQAEKVETQRIRDLLTLSDQDNDSLRTLNSQELSRHSIETIEKSKEIDTLKTQVSKLELRASQTESQASELVDTLRKALEKLRGEKTTLKEELGNGENLRETLENRAKNLEDEVKRLKRDLARRSSVPDVDNAKQQIVAVNSETILRKPNRDREIDRLKQEIQRYRMELTNRETNYNRRFADAQPIVVNRRPISGLTSTTIANGNSSNGYQGNLLQSGGYAGQERARTGREPRKVVSRSRSDDLVNSSSSVSPSLVRSSSSTASERLPHLDAKMTIRRPVLAKPLPSKLLISKRAHRTSYT